MARMSAIFDIFTQFLHALMTVYRNLTQKTTNGQKGSKRVKMGKNTRYLEKYDIIS